MKMMKLIKDMNLKIKISPFLYKKELNIWIYIHIQFSVLQLLESPYWNQIET